MMKNFILLFLIFFSGEIFASDFPTVQEAKAKLSLKDSLKNIAFEEYLTGRRPLDWYTQFTWDFIIIEINKDFDNNMYSFGRVWIRLGELDSISHIDRAEFLEKKLLRELSSKNWRLAEWSLDDYIHFSKSGWIYKWVIDTLRVKCP